MEGVLLYFSSLFIGGGFRFWGGVGGGAEKYILSFHCPKTFDLLLKKNINILIITIEML